MKFVLKKSVFPLFFLMVIFFAAAAGYAADLKPTGNENTFTQNMNLTSVWIDWEKLSNSSEVPEPEINNSNFGVIENPQIPGSGRKYQNGVVYKEVKSTDAGTTIKNGGSCFSYTYKDAAILADGTKADVKIAYSDVNLSITPADADSDPSKVPGGEVLVGHGSNMASCPHGNNGYTWRVGTEATVTITVENGTGDILYWIRGINATRGFKETGKKEAGYLDIPDSGDGDDVKWVANKWENIKPNYGWNEQVQMSTSIWTDHIYYPDDGYLTQIAYPQTGQVVFYGMGGSNNTYNTGFASAADAASGAKVTFRVGTSWLNNNAYCIDNFSYPTKIAHTILSSSGEGGSIKTFKSGSAGSRELPGGTWNGSEIPQPGNYHTGGASLQGPLMYTVPDGKSAVTYVMTPESGYIIDKFYIDGNEEKNLPKRNPVDGTYSYTFNMPGTENRSIHVTWKKVVDVVVKKEWVPDNSEMHPEKIWIELLQNGESMKPTHIKSLNADNKWTESFTELPADGNEYTVREDFHGVDNYRTVIDGSQSGNVITFTITNTKLISADFPLIWKVIEAPDESSLNTNYTFTISGVPLPKDESGKDVSSVVISSKDDPRQKTVGKVTFSAADGKYIYTVKEEPDPDGKYTVTPKEYKVTFTVQNGVVYGPVIQIDGQDYAGRDLVFTNEYPWPVGTTEARVRKRIDGFQPIDHHETYTFRIYRLTPGAPMPDAESDMLGYKEVTLTGEGETGFGPVHFTCRSDKDCEYKYSVREIIPPVDDKYPGETYDTTVYNCTLIIDHVTSEVINKIVEVDGKPVVHENNTYVFVNSFPDTMPTVEPKVRKVVQHGDPDRGDKFFFELELIQKPQGVEKDPMPVLSNGTKKVIDMNGEDILNGIAESFGEIQFEAYGEYVYKVRELQEKDLPEEEYYDKYAYDDNVFTVHYDVHPAADGKSIIADVIWYDKSGNALRDDGLVDGAVTFRNPLRLPDDADDIHVRKVIAPEGVEIEHTTPFSFTLELLDAPADLPAKPLPAEHSGGTLNCEYGGQDGSVYKCTLVSGSRNFYFGEMDFTVDGTYTFVVKEEAGDDPDFDYSTEAYYIIYEVANGAIVKKTVLTKEEEPYEDPELIFTNTYHKPLHTEVEAFVKKVILDGDPRDGDAFRFTLEARDESYPMPEGSSGRTKTIEVRASKDEPMESGFGPITFTKEGVYIYDVKEVKGDLDHYAYDSTIYTLIWTVTAVQKDLRSRQLEAELTIEMDGYREDVRTGETLLFENEYADPDEGTLMIRKLISGGTPPVREYFTFHAEGLETTAEGLEVSPLPEKCRENLCSLSILGTGHGYFGKVRYDRDGEYNYRIWEVPGESEDYEYDGSVYTVKMTVRDGVLLRDQIEIKRDGVLIPNHEAVISFENHYLKGYDEMHPTVEKIVMGGPEGDDPFVFRLQVRPDQPGNPMPSGAVDGILEITIDGEGLKNFGTIEFDEPGTYVYTITEVGGNDPAYRYDASVYTVTYEVTATETGTSVVRTVKKDGQDWTGREYIFTNIWAPDEPEDDEPLSFFLLDFPLPLTGVTSAGGFPRSEKPASVVYHPTEMELSIPGLGVLSNIVSVDLVDGEFPVQWLDMDVALLEGTARPGEGISVIAGHNTLNAEEYGPFAALRLLNIGDRFFVSNGSQLLIYEIYANEKIASDDFAALQAAASEFDNTLTLLTCEDEQVEGGYASRRIVAAKLVI